MILPNFMCIGAAKSGTTSLYDILRQHSDIFIPSFKEPHFFDIPSVYKNGISWGDAKNKLFEKVNEHILPIRDSYNSLSSNKELINDLLEEGSSKVRPMAKELLSEVRESIGISKIS